MRIQYMFQLLNMLPNLKKKTLGWEGSAYHFADIKYIGIHVGKMDGMRVKQNCTL